jgi:imidazolonepropionase-like amidohydrolase
MRRAFRIIRNIVIAIVAIVVVVVGAIVVALWPAPPLSVPPQGVRVAGVTVINPGQDRRANQTIVVSGGAIGAISDSSSDESDRRFAGAFVLPGLIDMHVHTPPPPAYADIRYFFLMYLAHGVTTIRDTGNDGFMLERRSATLRGDVAGPRIFTSGPIVDGDPPVWPFSRVVRNAADAGPVVASLAAQHVDFIKVYERLTPDALAAVERAAHSRGLPVVGHVPELVKFEDAHIDDVQHLTGVADSPRRIYHDIVESQMATARAWEAVDDARIKFIIDTSLAQHIAHTPTITVLDHISGNFDEEQHDLVVAMMPPYYPDVLWRGLQGIRPDQLDEFHQATQLFHAQLPKMKNIVRRLHEAGITVHLGTDTLNPFVVPGESLHEEMRNFLDAGYTPEQVWQSATAGNGASLPTAGLGTIKQGAPADLLIYKSDPTRDLGALDSLQAVVANGRLYTRDELDAAVKRNIDRFNGPAYRFVSNFLARAVTNANRPSEVPKKSGE